METGQDRAAALEHAIVGGRRQGTALDPLFQQRTAVAAVNPREVAGIEIRGEFLDPFGLPAMLAPASLHDAPIGECQAKRPARGARGTGA